MLFISPDLNYLAHLYLSGSSEGLLVGNFIADSVKGSSVLQYPIEIQKGILLHRAIDIFTDNHEVMRRSKHRLRKEFHKYAPVISDVFYDHFLAVKWKTHSSVSLRFFCNSTYEILRKNLTVFPEKSKMFFRYMVATDILFRYQYVEGIERALKGLACRAKFDSGMHMAHYELLKNYVLYEEEFELFFLELKAMVSQQHRF